MPLRIGDLVENSLNNYARKLRGGYDRKPGYHASSAGKCFRRALVERFIPSRKQDPSDESMRIFMIGHAFDEILKQAIEREVYEGDIFLLAPFATQTLIYDPDDEDHEGEPMVVHGEPDIVLLDFYDKCLHIIDGKSCAHDSFYYKQREGATLMNQLQVGSYAMSEQIKLLIKGLGWKRLKCWLTYMDKDNAEPVTAYAGKDCGRDAMGYWQTVKMLDEAHQSSGAFPMAVPQESWECGYCSIWPDMAGGPFKNKTAKRTARSAHRTATANMCGSVTTEMLQSWETAEKEVAHEGPAEDRIQLVSGSE